MQTKKVIPDLFKRTMLKICEGFKKKVKKKPEKSWGVGGSTIDPLEWKFQGGGGGV